MFPHSRLDLDHKLSRALESHRNSLLEAIAQEPSDISEVQGKPKESPESGQEEQVDEGHWVPAKEGNPGSFLLNPSDRDRFINWGKKKAKKKIQEGIVTLKQELEVLRPRFAAAAQEVYDSWVPDDDEGLDPEIGGGGICDEIMMAISGVISINMDAHIDEGGQDGDDHSYLLVSRAGERYWVDIPPNTYESGGGFSWNKTPDVIIRPEDVIIEPI